MFLVIAEVGGEVGEHSSEEVVGQRGDAHADADGHIADVGHVGAADAHKHLTRHLVREEMQ